MYSSYTSPTLALYEYFTPEYINCISPKLFDSDPIKKLGVFALLNVIINYAQKFLLVEAITEEPLDK